MSEEKKRPESEKEQERKNRIPIGKIFYHNTFVLAFSFAVAVVTWFLMAASSTERDIVISDVPVEVRLSAAAEEEGLQVFQMNYTTVDVQVSGNNMLTSQLTASDFEAFVTLNPTSTKVEGNTLQKMTLSVSAVKQNAMASYEIVGVTPNEVTVEYDRYQEVNLPIENNIQYSSETGYFASTPVLSADNVTISGPESSVSRIDHVAVNYQVESPLRQDTQFTCPLVLYDANNQVISDVDSLYIEMNLESVDVSISVLPTKTVSLVAPTVRQPEGFSQSRIQIEPAEVTIAGSAEVLSGISEIKLNTVIDFAQLEPGSNNTFTAEIPLPSGVRNISAVGEEMSNATITVNLNGYAEATVTTSSSNIQVINPPASGNPEVTTTSLEVTVVGPEAQVTRLTGDAVSVQVDLSNFQTATGTVEVPATVSLTGSMAESCWVAGEYTVSVNFSSTASSGSSATGALAAAPQE